MQTKTFGYVRVSCKDQNTDRQINEMLAAGINERDIFIDMQSGKDFERPMYQALKRNLREGDKLYIKSLDRFGRNKEQILSEWEEITKGIKADIIVMDMPILDTTRYKSITGLETVITDIVLQLLSYFAEDERCRIKSRQAEGMQQLRKMAESLADPVWSIHPNGRNIILNGKKVRLLRLRHLPDWA